MQPGLEQGDHLDHRFDRLVLADDPRPKPVAHCRYRQDLRARHYKAWQPGIHGKDFLDERGVDGLVLADAALFVQVVPDLVEQSQSRSGTGRRRQELAAQLEQPSGCRFLQGQIDMGSRGPHDHCDLLRRQGRNFDDVKRGRESRHGVQGQQLLIVDLADDLQSAAR